MRCWWHHFGCGRDLLSRRTGSRVHFQLYRLLVSFRFTAMATPINATSLKRFGKNNYNAMIVGKSSPSGWSEETLFVRFVEQNGTNTMFIITGEALNIFKSCEKWLIYDMEIHGKCVRQCPCQEKYGFPNTQVVYLKFPCKMSLAQVAWPLALEYDCPGWDELNQRQPNTFVDLVGRVLSKPEIDVNSSIPKMRVDLGNGNFTQIIELLGSHANLSIKEGETVAFSSLKIIAYRQQRTMQSTFSTVVEINPTVRAGVPLVEDLEESEPKRKALKITEGVLMTVDAVQKLKTTMILQAADPSAPTFRDFDLKGHVTLLTEAFFDADAPVVGDTREIMRLSTSITDQTGSLDVTIWDHACYSLFGLAAPALRAAWENGIEHVEKREEVLEVLNVNLGKEVRASCTAKLVKKGFKNQNHAVSINVNFLQI